MSSITSSIRIRQPKTRCQLERRQCLTARCFGGAGVPTVTVAVAVVVPAAFVAVSLYAVVAVGDTLFDPSANTVPMP